jgi:hydroxymethylpyrimidine/phosphomethylpyrimidine kinase
MPEAIPRVKPVALTIAGSDSGGGAGIQADLKAMEANGVFGMSVITAVTAQNTRAVTAAFDLPLDIIEAQLDAVADDFTIGAVKTGMLSSVGIIELVARKVRERRLGPVVVDPVMVSKSGFSLLADDAVGAVRELLLPLARLVTPNTHEAERLTGLPVRTLAEAEAAARSLQAMGPEAVLVKGGHLNRQRDAVDVLLEGGEVTYLRAERIETEHTHGTGCTYAAAIAARLARGESLRQSVTHAKRYVTEAIRHGLPLGGGHGPTNHFYFLGEGAPVRG